LRTQLNELLNEPPMERESNPAFKNITIIGVGLIGGSLALAVKNRYPECRITGVDKPSVLKRAIERRVVDTAETSVKKAVQTADLVFLCTPISVITKMIPVIASNIPRHALITDTGSVKKKIMETARRFFHEGNFIGGHPMTGSEQTGIEAANPLLFQNAIYILTPEEMCSRRLLHKLAKFLSSLDARVIVLDAALHDSVTAAVSHLPQLAAVALMNTIGKYHPHAPKHLPLAAGGFRDMTRIASSPFSIWKDILTENKKEAGRAIGIYIRQLKKIASAINGRPSKLSDEFKTSRKLRARIPRSMKGYLSPVVDISVFIEDKPGEDQY
jgi:prephenate dehydrogenase